MTASWPATVAASIVRHVFAKPFADQVGAERFVQGVDLDWTVARATRLKDGEAPASGQPRLSTELFAKGPYSIARAAWAGVLLDLAATRAYIRQTVNVTG